MRLSEFAFSIKTWLLAVAGSGGNKGKSRTEFRQQRREEKEKPEEKINL